MVRTGTAEEAIRYHENTPTHYGRLQLQNSGWGGPDSNTFAVCRHGDPATLGDDDFGIFLGLHPEGWVVGIKDFDSLDGSVLTGCEIYSSLEELKKVWRVD